MCGNKEAGWGIPVDLSLERSMKMVVEMSRSDMLECFQLLQIVGKRQGERDYALPFRGLAVWEQEGKMVWSVCDSKMVLDIALPVEMDKDVAFQIADLSRVGRYVQTLSDDSVVMWKVDGGKCLIKEVGKRGGVRLPVLEYSLIEQPEWGEVLELELGELSTQGKLAANFCSNEEEQGSLRGVCISGNDMFAADGIWSARFHFPSQSWDTLGDVVLPLKIFDVLATGSEGMVQCSASKGAVRFEKGNVRLCLRLFAGDFPVQGIRDLEKQHEATEKFCWEIDAEAMAKALTRINLFASAEKWNAYAAACYLRVEAGDLIVTSADESDGLVEEYLEVNATGESEKVCVDAPRLSWLVNYVLSLEENLVLHCSGNALWMRYGGSFFMLMLIRGED